MYEVNLRFDVAGILRPNELTSMELIEMTVEQAVALSLQVHFGYVRVKQVSIESPPSDYPLDVDVWQEQ
ncbi:MAG: hypothetical protein ACYDER_23955 [Ktedonobacteraceae bacterium]